jgi:outer membrane receptor protein involved in Fe transport
MTALGASHDLTPSIVVAGQCAYSKWNAETAGEEHTLFQPMAHLGWHLHENHTLTVGGDIRHYEFERSGVDGAPDQDAIGGFVQHEWRIHPTLTLMGALRADAVDHVDPVAVSPKVSAVYSPDWPVRLRASISRGFHAPTLQELYEVAYGHGGTALRFGNPALEPEYSWTYSLGAEVFPVDPLELSVYGHYSDIDDMIVPVYEGAWAVDPTKDVWRRTNIEEAEVYGVETAARYTFSRQLRLEAGYTWTDQKDSDTGRQLPYNPGSSVYAKAVSTWDLDPFVSEWTITGFIGLRAVFDRSAWNWKPSATAPVGDPSGMITDLEDHQKLDAGIDLQHRDSLSIFFKVYNILQQDLEYLDDAYTVIDGEPVFKGGVRWRF